MTPTEEKMASRLSDQLAAIVAREPSLRDLLMPRTASYSYWRHGQFMYAYTTKRVRGAWLSYVYVPKGEGSRSGEHRKWTVTSWQAQDKVRHSTRRAAKARAAKLWLAVKAECEGCK